MKVGYLYAVRQRLSVFSRLIREKLKSIRRTPPSLLVPRGFTIVELLIVIVIVAILAAISTVAYNGIQRRAAASSLKNTLSSAAKAMEVAAVDAGAYEILPDTITIPEGVGIALTQVDDPVKSFCINATVQRYNDMIFSFNKASGVPEEGACSGEVLWGTGKVLGNYNTNAAAEDDGDLSYLTNDSRGVAEGDAYGFRAETDDTWTRVTLSWDAQSEAELYQIHFKDFASDTWYVVSTLCNAAYPVTVNSNSNRISKATTSYSVNGGRSPCTPVNMGQTAMYRLRYKRADDSYSEWSTISLSAKTGRSIPTVKNFRATPNDTWSRVTLSWDGVGNFSNLPDIRYQIHLKDFTSDTWYYVTSSCNVSYSLSGNGQSSIYSNSIPGAVTSFNLNKDSRAPCVPAATSQTATYRIRIISGSEAGEWATITLNPLAHTNQTIPRIQNFTVTPNETWSQVTLSWGAMPANLSSLPGIKYQVHVKDFASDTWYVVSNSCNATYPISAGSNSNSISEAETSYRLSSNSRTPCVPRAAGQTATYRIRIASGSEAGEWTTVTLSR